MTGAQKRSADTQWPRFQVFLQPEPGAPHQDVGSVHAPDPEMALMNARDVFVRRPECASLWVAPAEVIFSQTAEELAAWPPQAAEANPEPGAAERYYVFCKTRQAGAQTLAGHVEAATPREAIRLAVAQFSGKQAPFAWWVLPARQVLASDPAEAGSLFDPALDKPFRLSTDFHTVTAMRGIKRSDS